MIWNPQIFYTCEHAITEETEMDFVTAYTSFFGEATYRRKEGVIAKFTECCQKMQFQGTLIHVRSHDWSKNGELDEQQSTYTIS
ncbi:hypothetical protein TNCT_109621 [Trichonephila clavata]|uniref:Uncharacterized protein n=1 Tax=Trichonephila clavata TaxID=2740835 RepID=A0A8X6LWR2_TRICU|nr:hypothetical protein TNCT_109621 [Trichonephila clavata]